MADAFVCVRRSMPMLSITECTRAPMSGSSVDIGSAASSSTVTSSSRRIAASDISTRGQCRDHSRAVVQRLHPEHSGRVDPGQVRPDRHRSGRDHELVEADAFSACYRSGEHMPGVHVDLDDLGMHPHVDPAPSVLFWGPGHQVLGRLDVAGDPVRDAAGGE
jgi:hypothetical protein